jgi:hypothetical protein
MHGTEVVIGVLTAADVAVGVARVVCVVAGAALVLVVGMAALRTVVVPRAEGVWLSRVVFVNLRKVFDRLAHEGRSYEDRDKIMSRYAPLALIFLPISWSILVVTGFTLMFWGAVAEDSWRTSFYLSGASFTTLGSFSQADVAAEVLSFVEAGIGLGLVALLISYLPSIYGAFQRRELQVTMLETLAGGPPSAIELIERHGSLDRLDAMNQLWGRWQEWFADVEETHTSQAALAFFRSPEPGRSWVTAAGTVLDAASLQLAVIDAPRDPQAALCVRAGFLCLRKIATLYGMPHPLDPAPDDPISITRREFDLACTRLHAAGVPLKADRDQAWRDFAGWRVNYDVVLRQLAGLTMAPWALWSGDRAVPYRVRVTPFGRLRRSKAPDDR